MWRTPCTWARNESMRPRLTLMSRNMPSSFCVKFAPHSAWRSVRLKRFEMKRETT